MNVYNGISTRICSHLLKSRVVLDIWSRKIAPGEIDATQCLCRQQGAYRHIATKHRRYIYIYIYISYIHTYSIYVRIHAEHTNDNSIHTDGLLTYVFIARHSCLVGWTVTREPCYVPQSSQDIFLSTSFMVYGWVVWFDLRCSCCMALPAVLEPTIKDRRFRARKSKWKNSEREIRWTRPSTARWPFNPPRGPLNPARNIARLWTVSRRSKRS